MKREQIIGHIHIVKSDSSKSIGKINFKGIYNKSEFDPDSGYAKFKKRFNNLLLLYCFSPNDFRLKSSIEIRYMIYGKYIGGYGGLGVVNAGKHYNAEALEAGNFLGVAGGLTIPITRTLQFSSGIWSTLNQDIIGGLDLLLIFRIRNISIMYGQSSAQFGNEFAEWSSRFGLGFTF